MWEKGVQFCLKCVEFNFITANYGVSATFSELKGIL